MFIYLDERTAKLNYFEYAEFFFACTQLMQQAPIIKNHFLQNVLNPSLEILFASKVGVWLKNYARHT